MNFWRKINLLFFLQNLVNFGNYFLVEIGSYSLDIYGSQLFNDSAKRYLREDFLNRSKLDINLTNGLKHFHCQSLFSTGLLFKIQKLL